MSNSLDPDQTDIFLGLVWVETVCKGYQQTVKFKDNKFIKNTDLLIKILIHKC